jgi:hypothetical protein
MVEISKATSKRFVASLLLLPPPPPPPEGIPSVVPAPQKNSTCHSHVAAERTDRLPVQPAGTVVHALNWAAKSDRSEKGVGGKIYGFIHAAKYVRQVIGRCNLDKDF